MDVCFIQETKIKAESETEGNNVIRHENEGLWKRFYHIKKMGEFNIEILESVRKDMCFTTKNALVSTQLHNHNHQSTSTNKPNASKNTNEIEKLYPDLNTLCDQFQKLSTSITINAGDFNAKVGKPPTLKDTSDHGREEQNLSNFVSRETR